MKKRKVLGGVLFSLVLITLITLIMFLRENTISKFVNSETIKEFTSESKIKNKLNFKAEDEEYFPCYTYKKEMMMIKLWISMK